MEIYNFFSELVSEDDKLKLEDLKAIYEDLQEKCNGVMLIRHKNWDNKNLYQVIGQKYGDDTTAGDTELLSAFCDINYVWFDARNPLVNTVIEYNSKMHQDKCKNLLFSSKITGDKPVSLIELTDEMKRKDIHSIRAVNYVEQKKEGHTYCSHYSKWVKNSKCNTKCEAHKNSEIKWKTCAYEHKLYHNGDSHLVMANGNIKPYE